jgi:hypothetical protein
MLSDAVETGTGTYVDVTDTGSSPTSDDSDGDTLKDGDEVEENPFRTDPNSADTDGDGLQDDVEIGGDIVTDPTKEDTDGDGFKDALEVRAGTDPTDGADTPQSGGGTGMIGFNFSSDRQLAFLLMSTRTRCGPRRISAAPARAS